MSPLVFLITIFALIGVIFLFVSKSITRYSEKRDAMPYEIVSATITGMKIRRGEKITSHYPILSFEFNNELHTISSNTGVDKRSSKKPFNNREYDVGDVVDVRVFGGDVETAVINNEKVLNTHKTAGKLFKIFGIGAIIIAFLMLIILLAS